MDDYCAARSGITPPLPWPNFPPPFPPERVLVAFVTGTVALQFLAPLIFVSVRDFEEAAAFMCMPEAAMDKDHYIRRREHEVGFARKIAPMEPETQTARVQSAADNQLRLSILALDRSHISAAGRLVVDVSQRLHAAYLDQVLLRYGGP